MKEYSYQLYSSREHQPWNETYRMLATAGYKQVEGFGGVYSDPTATREKLDAVGLHMTSGHFSLESLENDLPGVLKTVKALGIEAVYCPFLAPDVRPTDGAGYSAIGQRLVPICEQLTSNGLLFGWHNHDFEFEALADDTIPMKQILDACPAMSWEIDVAWIVRSGADPLHWIERYGNRISSVHIKDIAPEGDCTDEDGWADVGEGTLDWSTVAAALNKTSVRYFIMEHDKPSDHTRFASRSIDYCREKLDA